MNATPDTQETPKWRPRKDYLRQYAVDEAGCWIWQGDIHRGGYGVVGSRYAHRFFYEAHVGPIPDGFHIDHLCRVRRCVNPAHLEAVTPRENFLRGVGPTAENARKTHCKRGHELAGDNLLLVRNERWCRICTRATGRASWHRRRAASNG